MRTDKIPVSKAALIDKVIFALGDSVEARLPGGKLWGKSGATAFFGGTASIWGRWRRENL